ncbi:MAG: LuxR C-terminal-related transcriptional regulator [Oscillospiraceae bacterium]|nr:LuxR C-terminal-related transcriptional regulator [Oscillospiraceae bacterium]
MNITEVKDIKSGDIPAQWNELTDTLPCGLILLDDELCVQGFNEASLAFFGGARSLYAGLDIDGLTGMLTDIAADSALGETELLTGHILAFDNCSVDYMRYDGKHYRISVKPAHGLSFRMLLLIYDISDITESVNILATRSRALASERSTLLSRLRFADAMISQREAKKLGKQFSGKFHTALDRIENVIKCMDTDAGLAELKKQRENADTMMLYTQKHGFAERLKKSLLPQAESGEFKIVIHHISSPGGCGEVLENFIIEAAREAVLLVAICGTADNVGLGFRSYEGGMELNIHTHEPVISDFKTAEPYIRLKKIVKSMRAELETDISNGFTLTVRCVIPVRYGLPTALVSLSDAKQVNSICETLGGGAEPMLRCIAALPNIDLKKACQKYSPAVLITEPDLIEKHTGILKKLGSKLKVIAVSSPDSNISVALRLYLDAYLPHNIDADSLQTAVSGVLRGLTVYSGKNTLSRTEDTVRRYGLSEIEQSILTMIGQGYSSEKIAADLHYSHGSLRNMLSAMYVKLGVGDRAQMTAFAILNGFADSFQGGMKV